MKKVIIILSAIIALSACKDKKQNPQEAEESFPSIAVPVGLASQEEAYNYLAIHFWDNFDLTDTAKINKEYTERALADYLRLLSQMPQDVRQQSIGKLLDRAHKTEGVYDKLTELLEKYLYNIESPLLNEETYNAVLIWQIENPNIAEDYKLRPRELYRVAQKNRVGSRAADFLYVTDEGMRTRLYKTEADFTILFFYNLGCEMCRTLREQMLEVIASSPVIAERLENGSIKIVAIYPDAEREGWETYKGDIPADWINGYDPTATIKNNEIYELRAIPSVYVLDGDKIVMVKDSFNAEQIFGEILKAIDAK